jgi:hypothetical protein
MINGLRRKVVVNEEVRIEVNSPDLHRGDVVEIIFSIRNMMRQNISYPPKPIEFI